MNISSSSRLKEHKSCNQKSQILPLNKVRIGTKKAPAILCGCEIDYVSKMVDETCFD